MEELVEVDRLIVMSQGRIVLEGSPAKVFQETQMLRELSLDVPQIVKLGSLLRQQGVAVPWDVLTVEELVDFLQPDNKA